MWRVILYLLAVIAIAFLCIFVVEQHGLVSLTFGSRGYEISLARLLGALLVAVVALYLVFRLLKYLLLLPFSAFHLTRSRRKARGNAAITRGLVAAASGDLVAAARHAQTAERLAGHEPLALLLKAQAAQLHGNRTAAKDAFARMAQIAETRGLGLRGLFVEARRSGDGTAANQHAAQATELDVFLPWAHEATLMAQCQARDWLAALATLERNHRLGAMDAGEMRRAKAALLAARALDLGRADPKEALKAALNALRIDPGLTPAAAAAASLLAHEGQQRKAARIVEAAWRLAPHPDLVEAYLGSHPGSSAVERLKQIAKLVALKPQDEESQVALGQALLAAREFHKARSALAPLAGGRPTTRICLLMAEIEEAENGMTGLAREWLARAAHAPRDPAWIADGAISPQWAPVAPETLRIGAFVWAHPQELVAAPSGSAHIPATVAPRGHMPMARPVLAVAPPLADSAPIQAAPTQAAPAEAKQGLATEAQGRPAVPAAADISRPSPEAKEAAGSVAGDEPPAGRGEAVQAAAPPAKGGTVAFALERAPDDPGAEPAKGKGLWERLTG
jgi:HemY protein